MYFKTTYLNSDFINILKAKGYTSDTINLEKLKSQCTHLGMTGNIKSYWRMVKEVKGIKVGLSCIQIKGWDSAYDGSMLLWSIPIPYTILDSVVRPKFFPKLRRGWNETDHLNTFFRLFLSGSTLAIWLGVKTFRSIFPFFGKGNKKEHRPFKGLSLSSYYYEDMPPPFAIQEWLKLRHPHYAVAMQGGLLYCAQKIQREEDEAYVSEQFMERFEEMDNLRERIYASKWIHMNKLNLLATVTEE